MDEINLAAALQFLLDGRADQLVVPAGDHRLNGHAVLGRRLDHAHVAQPHQRHVQGARNRRGRHGQHVHFFAKLLQPLLVAHAEALLLVDDHQPEVGELDVLREQAVRADQDVHLAALDLLDDLLLLLGGAEAADHLDVDRERGESPLEGLKVLEGQHRGGRQHRDLLAVAHRLEGGAHGDFRLAVTDIAAQQAVHRASADSMSRLTSAMAAAWSSVSLNSKASSNSRIHSRVRRKGMALGGLALGIEL